MRWSRPAAPEERSGPLFLVAILPLLAAMAVLAIAGELGRAALLAAIVGLVVAATLALRRNREAGPAGPADDVAPDSSTMAIFPDPVIVVDRRGIVTEANEAARALLPAVLPRRPLAFALRDPRVLEAIPAVAGSGVPTSVEIGGRVPGEAVHEVRLRRLGAAAPALGEPAVALFFRDLSAERRLEAMRVDFIANVSHELRTPLASLSGFIETLQGPAKNDEPARTRFLAIMGVQADRMTRLVNDLLQLSRVELKEHVRPVDRVDLTASVAHMLEILAPRARERGAVIAAELPAEAIMVLGDRDEILRLVENLVENAIRYGGSSAPIKVALMAKPATLGAAGHAAELVVRDRGPGIPREHLPRLTERFYRVDVAESRQSGGTGLGLAIVKHIVGRHRGRLTIESEPGEGATFTVTFPLAEGGAPTVT